ncbi:MAG: DUF551 domain-containing protein [bacterium]|nr:DUF551 domain-containing protein [bacterium]
MNWISVKDKLPDKYGTYWVYRQKCNKQHARVWNGTWWAYDGNEITHWAYFPEPPELIK